MRVLMFGWEFPPHISGGLGTACFGLTHALVQTDIDVLFVVPKLHGDEPGQEVSLVDASSVPFTEHQSKKIYGADSRMSEVLEEHFVERRRLETIGIPSSLSPYHPVRQRREHQQRETLERWNYQLPEKTAEPGVMEEGPVAKKQTFSFSGGYGERLFDEVERYANVAAEITSGHSFDVIHAHDWMTFPAGIAAKARSGKPLVVHVHATEFDRAGEHMSPVVYKIEKEGMQHADKIVAVSQWTKDILVRHYKINKHKIKVVHNGIVPMSEQVKPAKSVLGAHVITFLGRITHQKGPQYFVEAARKVIQKFPDAHFIMAGSGDLFPQIIERVAQARMSSQFHFTGFLKKAEINKLLSMTNVYVMPSVSEPFGITPLEAIQAGIPVIISNQSGVAEVMPHALKVDFWDSQALADTICSVLKYDSLSKALKENGMKEIENITWHNASQKLKKIYYELTQKNYA